MTSSPYQPLSGTVAILLFLGFIAWVFFMGDVTLRSGREFYVEFNQLGIIETGAAVRIGDQKVGVVKQIMYHDPGNNKKPRVRLKLWVDKRYASWIYKNSRFYFESISIIGQRHINISPPPENEPLGELIGEDDVVPGIPPAKIDRVLKKVFDTIQLALKTNRDLKPEWERASSSLDELKKWEPFFTVEVMPALREITKKARMLRTPPGLRTIESDVKVGHMLFKLYFIDAIISKFEVAVQSAKARIDANTQIWEPQKIKAILNRMERRVARMKRMVRRFKPMLLSIDRALNSKAGTVGALIQDKTLWDDLKMMAKRLKNAPLDLLFKRRSRTRN